MDNERVEYDSDIYGATRRRRVGGIIGLLIRWGLAKDEQSANVVMMWILIGAVVIGVGVWFVV